ncbi:MAG: glycosyltransferase family 2 protein [Bryobacteraceae bacterium]
MQSQNLGVPFSVIVVNFNRRELLRACLLSLAQQSVDKMEVIVVDNGSSDGSAEMVERDFAQNAKFSLQLIKNKENHGFCGANNQGIRLAGGKFVALLNNDAEAEPDWLTELSKPLLAREDIGMTASKILVHENPRRIDKVGHLIYLDGQNRGRGAGQMDDGQFDKMEEVLWPDGCAAMYRKSMLDDIGGFDEDLFAYGDDAELGMRARIAGWGCIYAPHAVVRHHRGATLGVLSSRRLELIERNRALLALRHFPPVMLFLSVFYFLLRLGAGAWAAVRGKGEVGKFPGVSGKTRAAVAVLVGNWEALTMAPLTIRKRRNDRRSRKLSNRQIRRLLCQYRISLKELMEQAI